MKKVCKLMVAGMLALVLTVAPAQADDHLIPDHLEDQFAIAASFIIGLYLLGYTIENETRKRQDGEKEPMPYNNITVWHPAPDPLYNLSDLPCAPKTASPSMNLKVRILCW